MVLAIVIIAAVTSIICTALLAAGLSTRPDRPCLFDHTAVYTGASRYDGGKCSGKPDNVYASLRTATSSLDGVRVCNGHVKLLLDVSDQLVRESTDQR